jgi:L-fuculokinase
MALPETRVESRSAQERYALATLYCALMSDYCLDMLGADTGPVIIEGSFTGNPYFAGVLAALRPGQAVEVSSDTSGTTHGGWMLRHWGGPALAAAGGDELASPMATLLSIPGLQEYRAAWRAAWRAAM